MQDDRSSKNVSLVARLTTNDLDELLEFIRGWDQEYIKLKNGNFEWETCIVQIGDFQFSEEFYGAPVLFRGSTPPGTFGIAIPKVGFGETLYGGNIIGNDCCITGNFDRYLDLRCGAKTSFLILVVPIDQILAHAEQIQHPITRKQLLSPEVIVPNPTALQKLSDYISELVTLAKVHPENLMVNSQGNSIANLIIEDSLPLVLDLFTAESNFLPVKKSSRRKLAQDAETFIRDRIDTPITLTELCQELKTGQRALYYAFQEYFGLPPMQYLKILRLHGVRRALKSAVPQSSKVSKIAEAYGFWHMGQFSADYRKMFGESPSTTLKQYS